MKFAIKTFNLTKKFNNLVAVDKLNIKVKFGEIFGLLGPNGAGKTTTIKMLSTLLKPTLGTAEVAAYNIQEDSDDVRRSIGMVFQESALDNRLTGRENLDFHARMYGMDRSQREKQIDKVLNLVGLKDKADVLVDNYSSGMKRRLEIARGLMHYPNILFLDEPTLGLDAQTRRSIWEEIKKLNKKEGITILLTTHYMEEADYLCDRVAIIDHGKILIVDSPKNLKNLVGKDVITLECSNSNKLVSILKKERWVGKIKEHGSFLDLGVKQGEKKIPKVVNLARKNNVIVKSINLRKPTLEDVYLHYTGKTIREEEAGIKDKMRRRISMRRRI